MPPRALRQRRAWAARGFPSNPAMRWGGTLEKGGLGPREAVAWGAPTKVVYHLPQPAAFLAVAAAVWPVLGVWQAMSLSVVAGEGGGLRGDGPLWLTVKSPCLPPPGHHVQHAA